MKIYVSWSGDLARHAAEYLRSILGRVSPRLDVWMTGSDISVGMRWVDEIQDAIRTSDLAIVCVTKESRSSPWINFELGMLVASRSRVVPWVIDLEPSELSGPLAQYRATNSFEDLLRFIVDVDAGSVPPMRARLAELSREFDEYVRHLTGRGARASVDRTHDEWMHRLDAAVSARNVDELRSVRADVATQGRAELKLVRALLRAHRTLRDFDGLIDTFETFRDAADGNAECQSLLAFALLRTEKYAAAISVLQKARQLDPQDPEIVGLLGQAYKNHWRETGSEDSLKRAADAYTEGFQLNPSHYHFGLNAVELLHLIGDDQSTAQRDRLLPEVERRARNAYALDPHSPWALASLLELAVVKNTREEAEEVAVRLQMRKPWERSSAAEQLRMLSGAKTTGKKVDDWVLDLISRLER